MLRLFSFFFFFFSMWYLIKPLKAVSCWWKTSKILKQYRVPVRYTLYTLMKFSLFSSVILFLLVIFEPNSLQLAYVYSEHLTLEPSYFFGFCFFLLVCLFLKQRRNRYLKYGLTIPQPVRTVGVCRSTWRAQVKQGLERWPPIQLQCPATCCTATGPECFLLFLIRLWSSKLKYCFCFIKIK